MSRPRRPQRSGQEPGDRRAHVELSEQPGDEEEQEKTTALSVTALPLPTNVNARPTTTVVTGAAKGNRLRKSSGTAIAGTAKGRNQPGPRALPVRRCGLRAPRRAGGGEDDGEALDPPRAQEVDGRSTEPTVATATPARRHPAGRLSILTSDALRYIVIQTHKVTEVRQERNHMTAYSRHPTRRPPPPPPERRSGSRSGS